MATFLLYLFTVSAPSRSVKETRDEMAGPPTDVVAQAEHQATQGEGPKDGPEGSRHLQLQPRRLVLQVKRQDDGDGHDGHVDRQSEIREESCHDVSNQP